MSSNPAPIQTIKIAQLESMKQSSGGDFGAESSFGSNGISSEGFFDISVMQGGMHILEDKSSIDSSVQSEGMMQSLFAKFNAMSDNSTSFTEMLNIIGPFPIMRQRMQTFIKFVGSTKLSNISLFSMVNMPKSLTAFKNSQQEQR